MNIILTDEELNILNKIIDDGHASDFETALRFLIYMYDLRSNEVA